MTDTVMTPAEFARRMEVIDRDGDTEAGHAAGDKLLCEVLAALGYAAGVKVWEDMNKWYA